MSLRLYHGSDRMISDEEICIGDVIYFYALSPNPQESKLGDSALIAGIVTEISKNKVLHMANLFVHNKKQEYKNADAQSGSSQFIIPYHPVHNQGGIFTEQIVATPKSILKYTSQQRNVEVRLFKGAKIGLLGGSIEDVLKSTYERLMHLGDLMFVSRPQEEVIDHYIGFITSMSLDSMTLSNYHPNMRHPWIKKNNFSLKFSESHNITTLRKHDDFMYLDKNDI